jgi:hypothetical protein
MYDPTLGRFLQRDPAGVGAADVNLYAYVGGRPARDTDPLGAIKWETARRVTDEQGLPVAWEPYGTRGPVFFKWEAQLDDGKTWVTVWAPSGIAPGRYPPAYSYWCHGFTFGGWNAPNGPQPGAGPFSPGGAASETILAVEWEKILYGEVKAERGTSPCGGRRRTTPAGACEKG